MSVEELNPDLPEAVIEDATLGQREAVERLVSHFMPRVFGLCLRMTRHRHLAEEASQESFVRILRALPKLRKRDRIRSWILTIAANTSRELLRKRNRVTELDFDLPAPIEEIDEATAAQQKALDWAISNLKTDDRALFLLHTIEGVKLKDLAEDRKTTIMAVKSKIHRIRSKVRVSALAQLKQSGTE
ncbi:MAG: sigma-70 family RNA polymerase sigma factor [Planctomycetota bacterium]|nr:sigma-70 family RNA polymerase sigma factor [Planctomycetota bacterium]